LSSDPHVLVVSEKGDIHAAAVIAVLNNTLSTTAQIIDLSLFPQSAAGSYKHRADEGVSPTALLGGLSLDRVRSVWWRRALRSTPPKGLDPQVDSFRQAECDDFVRGLLWQIPGVQWVNSPSAEQMAANKLVQLSRATIAGLNVPDTLITNDPVEALGFIGGQPGKVIFKRTGTSRGPFSETRIFEEQHRVRIDLIKQSPTTFQEYVEPDSDVRIVWAGGSAIAVRIDSRSAANPVDSRLDNSVKFEEWEIPQDVYLQLSALMADLGLVFGVIDMRLGLDGKAYFLEINPQGQFAYLEIKTGLPMCSAVARLLSEGPTRSFSRR